MTDVADVFKALSGAARIAGSTIPGLGGVVAGAAGEAFGLVADLIEAGHDPVQAIRRLREREPILADVDREWERAIDEKFRTGADDPYANLDEEW